MLVAVAGDGVQGSALGCVEGAAADVIDEPGGPVVELAAGDAAAPVAWPDARPAVDEVVELGGAPLDFVVAEGDTSPVADRSAQDAGGFLEQHDRFGGGLPAVDGVVPARPGALGEIGDSFGRHQGEEHGLAVAVGVVVEALHSALAEKGAARPPGGDPGAREAGLVVEDAAGVRAPQARHRLAEQACLEDVASRPVTAAADVVVAVDEHPQDSVGRAQWHWMASFQPRVLVAAARSRRATRRSGMASERSAMTSTPPAASR